MYVEHAEVVLPNVKTMAVFVLILLLFLLKKKIATKQILAICPDSAISLLSAQSLFLHRFDQERRTIAGKHVNVVVNKCFERLIRQN